MCARWYTIADPSLSCCVPCCTCDIWLIAINSQWECWFYIHLLQNIVLISPLYECFQIRKKNDIIKRLQSELHQIEKYSEEQIRRVRADAEKQEAADEKNSDGKRQKLQTEVAQLRSQLQNATLEHRESEQELRRVSSLLSFNRQSLKWLNQLGDCFQFVARYVVFDIGRKNALTITLLWTREFEQTGCRFWGNCVVSEAISSFVFSSALLSCQVHAACLNIQIWSLYC